MALPQVPDDHVLAYTGTQYDQQIAPTIVGCVVAFTLFGASFVQFVDCYPRLRWDVANDRRTFWYLNVLAFFDLVDSIAKGIFLIQYLKLVVSAGVFGSLTLPKVAVLVPAIDGAIAVLNHAIYMYRIFRLTPDRGPVIWGGLILAGLISITQFVASIYTSTWTFKPLPTWNPSITPWFVTWMGGSGAADLLLTLMFMWCLSRHKSSFSKTNQLVLRYIMLSLETGLLSTGTQFAAMILWLAMPDRPLEITIGLFQSKLYCNSILLMIRTTLANRDSEHNTVINSNSHIASFSRPGMGGVSGQPKFNPAQSYHSTRGANNSYSGQSGGLFSNGVKISTNVAYERDDMEMNDRGYDQEKYQPQDQGGGSYIVPRVGHGMR